MAEDAPLVPLEPSGFGHGTPPEGLECLATMDDITADDANYCEYQTMPSGTWHAAKYCSAVVQRFIRTQFPEYVSGVRKADCEADLKRRLGKGPPIWVEDKHVSRLHSRSLPRPSRPTLQAAAHSLPPRRRRNQKRSPQ